MAYIKKIKSNPTYKKQNQIKLVQNVHIDQVKTLFHTNFICTSLIYKQSY